MSTSQSKTGSAEVSKVSRVVKLAVQSSSDDVAAASRNSGKKSSPSAKNGRFLFTFVLRTCEDGGTYDF